MYFSLSIVNCKSVCKKCNALEDEIHSVTACTLNSIYTVNDPNFLSYSNAKKFKFILQKKKKLIQILVCFYTSGTLLVKFCHHAVENLKFIV